MGSLSSFFKPSQSAKFTPTKIKFADFYKSATQGGKLGGNVLTTVKETMRKAGYTDVQIAKMITANEALPVARIKEIATHLSRGKVYGFDQDPDRAVKKFLNQERVKAQSIAAIRKEHILEAAEENLTDVGTTSLNQKAIGPNSYKQGQPSILSRKRESSAVYSISNRSGSTKTESFNSRSGSTSITRPGVGGGGSSGGISIKPKF